MTTLGGVRVRGEDRERHVYADPDAVVRWLRPWLSGKGRGSMASDVGLTSADCVAVQVEIGGWPIPGSRKASKALRRLVRQQRPKRVWTIVA